MASRRTSTPAQASRPSQGVSTAHKITAPMSASNQRRMRHHQIAPFARGDPALAGSVNVYLLRAMESLWLLAAGLVPILFAPPDFMVFPDVPKVVLLRSLVALMAVAWALEWAFGWSTPAERPVRAPTGERGGEARLRRWLRWAGDDPRLAIITAGTLFIVANAISTVASESINVSLWGGNPGRDGYGFLNSASYYALFLAVATHVKSAPQVWRLLGAITFAAFATSLYGVFQHFGADPLVAARPVRITSSFGNALFAASFLVLALPATLALATVHLRQKRPLWAMAGWSIVIVVQLLAIMYTLSRGPWLALAAGVVVWLSLIAFGAGRRHALSAAALGGAAAIVAFGFTFVAGGVTAGGSAAGRLVAPTPLERASTISGEVASGGLGGRVSIWERSASLIVQRPWLEEDGALSSVSRHLFGYGPDLFVYALPLKWNEDALAPVNASAHNYPIHVALELGLVGLASYLALIVVLLLTSLRAIGRKGTLDVQWRLVYAALAAAVAIRVVEQMSGVARISDTALFWMLAGLVAALPVVHAPSSPTDPEKAVRIKPARSRDGRAWGGVRRWALALSVTVLAAGLIWGRSLPYARAAVRAADSLQAVRHGDLLASLSLMEDAISIAPDVELYHTTRAQLMSSFEARDDTDRVQIALEQHTFNRRALAVNPLSHTATQATAISAAELARLGRTDFGPEAVELYTRLTVMLPGYETAYADLASVYLIVGEPLGALRALDDYVEGTGGTVKPAAGSRYIRGVAFDELGQAENAVAALEGYISDSPDGRYVEFANRRLATLYKGLGLRKEPDGHATAAEAPRP